jgi:hypothetical protein
MLLLLSYLERVRLEEPKTNSGVAWNELCRAIGGFWRSLPNDYAAGVRTHKGYVCGNSRTSGDRAQSSCASPLHGFALGLRRRSPCDARRTQAQAQTRRRRCNQTPLTGPRQAARRQRDTRKTRTPTGQGGRALYLMTPITLSVQDTKAFGQVKNDCDRFFSYQLEGASCKY